MEHLPDQRVKRAQKGLFICAARARLSFLLGQNYHIGHATVVCGLSALIELPLHRFRWAVEQPKVSTRVAQHRELSAPERGSPVAPDPLPIALRTSSLYTHPWRSRHRHRAKRALRPHAYSPSG